MENPIKMDHLRGTTIILGDTHIHLLAYHTMAF